MQSDDGHNRKFWNRAESDHALAQDWLNLVDAAATALDDRQDAHEPKIAAELKAARAALLRALDK